MTDMDDMDDVPEIKVLDMLMKDFPPLLRGREPHWLPKPPACYRSVRIPDFGWYRDGYREIPPEELLVLDLNGAFLAPVSSTYIAHGALEHTGPKEFDNQPGYWLIDTHRWPDDRIASPIGRQGAGTRGWYTTNTVKLLIDLLDEGFWPDFRIYDSWTCATKVRAEAWAAEVVRMRAEAIADDDDPDYALAVKKGYAKAFQMMLGPKDGKPAKAGILRPDWNHAYRAEHAGRMWRKAAWLNSVGIPVMAMSHRDTITIWREDYDILLSRIKRDPKAKVRIDNGGIVLGAFKIKEVEEVETAA